MTQNWPVLRIAAALAVLAVAGCGEPATDAATGNAATSAAEDATAGRQPITVSVLDSSSYSQFLIVPGKGDTGMILADGTAYELRSAGAERNAAGDGDGGLVRIDEATSRKLSGRKVKVSVSMRSSPGNGSPAIRLMYSRPGAEKTSGWQEFPATADYSTVSFDYVVPLIEGSSGSDMIAFWADPEGKGRGIEIKSVEVQTVD